MNRMIYPLLALALAAAPATLGAQTADAAHAEAGMRMRRGAPLAGLLAHKAELGLTEDQVARLEAIRQDLEEKNRPLFERLREAHEQFRATGEAVHGGMGPLGQMTDEERAQLRERWQRMTPEQRREARAKMRQEMRERYEAMTPEQREELRQRREERRAAMRERMKELRPVMEQIRENRRQAMRQAREVLTEEQRTRLRELRRERAAEHRGHPARGGRRDHDPRRQHR